MEKNIKILLAILILCFVSSIANAACTVVEYTDYWCPGCTDVQNRGVGYATGSQADCKAACKAWGTTGTNLYTGVTYKTYYFAYYSSHPYWFPGNANAKCEVTDRSDYWKGYSGAPTCPTHADGGIPACNY